METNGTSWTDGMNAMGGTNGTGGINGAGEAYEAGTGTILIVEDNEDIREVMSVLLAEVGYDVATAGDGLEALAWLRAHRKPALILLDWSMPRCDGPGFRALQLTEPGLAPIPVILVTAEDRPVEKAAAMGLDRDDCIPKPFDFRTLLAAIESHKAGSMAGAEAPVAPA
jgi:CheY-like chemotaxis protein